MGAGGNAGNASLPPTAALGGPREAGREVGADDGFEGGADEEDPTHGTVDTLLRLDDAGVGRPGNGLLDEASPEAVPHERVCETDDLDD